MKLKTFDKIMMVLIMLAIIVASAFIVYICWSTYPPDYIGKIVAEVYANILNRVVITIVAIMLSFLSLRILFVRTRNPNTTQSENSAAPGLLIRVGDNGAAYITNAALEGMILKNVRANPKVRDCVCSIIPNKEFISISLKATLSAEVSIPETTQEIQAQLKENIETLTGISVRDVQVLVEDASKTLNAKK